jgi:DNA-binding CsgD family transcriptional regulator
VGKMSLTRAQHPGLHLLSKRLVTSEPPREPAFSPTALASGALARSPFAAALIDEADGLLMANEQCLIILRHFFGAPEGLTVPLGTLARSFRTHAHTLRRALENSDRPIMQLSPELCCRGSLLHAGAATYLLVLFEPADRRDMVERALDACGLTPRERDVAELVLEGLTNRAVADRLTLAEYTVETHVKRILTKVDVPTRSAFVAKILGYTSS